MRVFKRTHKYSTGINVFHGRDGDDNQSYGEIHISAPYDSYDDGTDGRLFNTDHTPPHVTSLASTSPAHVGPLLGMADRESKSRWGQSPVPSDDLSSHSSKIVKGLKDKGIVGKDTNIDQSNKLGKGFAELGESMARDALRQHDTATTFNLGQDYAGDLGKEIGPAHYRAGGVHMRQTLRDAKRNASPQFADPIHPGQGQLF